MRYLTGGVRTLVVVMLVLAGPRSAPADRECADVDCNGRVTASDALAVLKAAVGQIVATSCRATCDGGSATTTSTSTSMPGSTSTTLQGSGILSGELVVSEIMADPSAVSDTVGEWFEIVNVAGRVVDLDGVSLRDDASDLHVLAGADLLVQPGQTFVLGRNSDSTKNGGIPVDYAYGDFVLGNAADEIILEFQGVEIDRVVYGAGFAKPGIASSLDPGSLDADDNDDPANWCGATQTVPSGDLGSPGAPNPACPHEP